MKKVLLLIIMAASLFANVKKCNDATTNFHNAAQHARQAERAKGYAMEIKQHYIALLELGTGIKECDLTKKQINNLDAVKKEINDAIKKAEVLKKDQEETRAKRKKARAYKVYVPKP